MAVIETSGCFVFLHGLILIPTIENGKYIGCVLHRVKVDDVLHRRFYLDADALPCLMPMIDYIAVAHLTLLQESDIDKRHPQCIKAKEKNVAREG